MRAIFLILCCANFLFACYGCIDAPAAKAGAQIIMRAYDAGDMIVAKEIDGLIDKVKSSMKIEVDNHKKLVESRGFQIDSIAELKSLSFYKNKENEIIAMDNNESENEKNSITDNRNKY